MKTSEQIRKVADQLEKKSEMGPASQEKMMREFEDKFETKLMTFLKDCNFPIEQINHMMRVNVFRQTWRNFINQMSEVYTDLPTQQAKEVEKKLAI